MPSQPLLVRLLARSSDGWPPTEVTGGGYRPQVALFALEPGGCAVLAEDVRFARVPAHVAIGVEVADRRRVWTIPTDEPAVIADGADVCIHAGALRVCSLGSLAATGGAASDPVTVTAGGPVVTAGTPVGARLGDGAPGSNRPATRG